MEQWLLQSLLAPSAYPEPASSVHLIQTHVSFIFITDSFAYKIKKPVDLGFLNFTTLDRRRFYCNEEVRLNRRLCPEVYLAVVEVRESEEGARFDGDGKVVDYAVKMIRLPEERMMDRLLMEGSVTGDDIKRIARTIGEFHLKTDRGDEISEYGSPTAIRQNWDENFQQLERFVPAVISREDLRMLMDWVDTFPAQNAGLFAGRIAGGFIRDCDGDLHMGNICLTDHVCIFDCIEFNNRFRYSDTAADIAFLLMDLEFHGRSDFSRIFLAEYIKTTGDSGVSDVLDFYKVYRAVIRGKVASFKLHDPDIPEGEKKAAQEMAARYLRLARGYLLRKRLPPALIITCGLMGSGKSSIAAALSFELGIDIYSSDIVRKELAHVPKYSRTYSGYGEGMYSPGFNDATYDELLARAEKSLSAGESVIIDATFRRKSDRVRFQALAGRFPRPFYIVQTICPDDLIKERLDTRKECQGTISDGRWELFAAQAEQFEPLNADEGNIFTVDTTLSIHDAMDRMYHAMEIL